MTVKTNVYIDGFNLYHRAVEGTPYKWLDLSKLCKALLPSHQLSRIRYFTALVLPRPSDPQAPQRQQMYLRALSTIPNLTIHFGQFRNRVITRPLAAQQSGVGRYVQVLDTEEKGSDVNLATFLLVDAYNKGYEQALVISNDSDLALPIRLVRETLNLPVGVVNPNTNPTEYTPKDLTDAATFTRRLRGNTLRDSQFPPTLRDAHGIITKPAIW